MSRDPRYYEPDPIKAPRAADSAAPPPAPAPPGAAGPAGDTDPPTADAPPAFPLQPRLTSAGSSAKFCGCIPRTVLDLRERQGPARGQDSHGKPLGAASLLPPHREQAGPPCAAHSGTSCGQSSTPPRKGVVREALLALLS
ncbi:uncharacterized protein [Taeniopygia guttata]|uniref:uncharacterized protein isoform X2 n=1 Tax=Taeniopygia guttata TaxID=59729 RepID=UPI003BB99EAB